jgi:hypothetical protein
VDFWQDGEEVLCSLFYCAPDGTCRVLTTGLPYATYLAESVQRVVDAGVDPLEIAPVFRRVVQTYAFSVMLPRLAAIAADVAAASGEEATACFRVTPMGDATLAAAMALLQRAQSGDAKAVREVKALKSEGGKALLNEAEKQLAAARKARGS